MHILYLKFISLLFPDIVCMQIVSILIIASGHRHIYFFLRSFGVEAVSSAVIFSLHLDLNTLEM